MTTLVIKGARRKRHEKRETLFFLLGIPTSFLAARHSRKRALPSLNLKYLPRQTSDTEQTTERNRSNRPFPSSKNPHFKKMRGRVPDSICESELHLLEN